MKINQVDYVYVGKCYGYSVHRDMKTFKLLVTIEGNHYTCDNVKAVNDFVSYYLQNSTD